MGFQYGMVAIISADILPSDRTDGPGRDTLPGEAAQSVIGVSGDSAAALCPGNLVAIQHVDVGIAGLGGVSSAGVNQGGQRAGFVVAVCAAGTVKIEVFQRGVPCGTPLDCIGLGFGC